MAQAMQDYVESRRIARMSHEPSEGPEQIVVNSLMPLNGVKPMTPSPFPILRPPSHTDRQQQTQQILYGPAAAAAIATLQRNQALSINGVGGSSSSNPAALNNNSINNVATQRSMLGSSAARSGSPSASAGYGYASGLASSLSRPNVPSPVSTSITPLPAATAHMRERVILPPPTSRWYPSREAARPVLGEALDPSIPSSVESPRALRRAEQRSHVAKEVQTHFLVNPPPGVGVKKRRSTVSGGGGNSRGNSARPSSSGGGLRSPSATGGGSAKKKKGVLQPANAIPSTTDAIAEAVKYQAEAASAGQPYIPNNLKALMAVVRSFMDDEGRLNPVSFTKALRDLGVSDASIADNIFRRLESRGSPGYVHYGTVVAAFHEALNGAGTKSIVSDACFSLFDKDGQGYVHKAHLAELKFMRVTLRDHPMCTPHMVKVLTDLFQDVKAKEEEHYINVVIRKGKKSSKKKPPQLKTHQNSVIPVERKVVQHIDRTLFAAYFATHREVALAFAPRWIPMIDTHDEVGMAASEAMMRYENPPTPRGAGGDDAVDDEVSLHTEGGGLSRRSYSVSASPNGNGGAGGRNSVTPTGQEERTVATPSA